jgi:hypothetical protein
MEDSRLKNKKGKTMSIQTNLNAIVLIFINIAQKLDPETNELIKNIMGISLILISILLLVFNKKLDEFLNKTEKTGDRFYKKEYHEMYKARVWLGILVFFFTGLWMLLFLGK